MSVAMNRRDKLICFTLAIITTTIMMCTLWIEILCGDRMLQDCHKPLNRFIVVLFGIALTFGYFLVYYLVGFLMKEIIYSCCTLNQHMHHIAINNNVDVDAKNT